jgi:hypothetical protein
VNKNQRGEKDEKKTFLGISSILPLTIGTIISYQDLSSREKTINNILA